MLQLAVRHHNIIFAAAPKSVSFNAKFIILNTKFIIFNRMHGPSASKKNNYLYITGNFTPG